jgi:hypothetical protein
MNAISEDITQEDIDQATTQNRAILQERFPELDISVGGAVDSLLVDGNVAITAQNDANVDQIQLFSQLQAIAEGTVTIDDEDLDRLMANYFLTRREDTLATGTVVFVVRDNRNYTFQTGYRLRTANQTYQLTTTYNIYPLGTTGVDFTLDTNVEIQQVYDSETGYEYRFELPIESLEATPEAVLVSGDRLTVDQGFDGLGYVEANTNFQGGVEAETNQEFAARGLEGLLAYTVGGQDHIRKIVTETVQLSDSYAIGTGDPMMTRDRDNVFNIPTGGKVDIYVKTGAIASASYQVDAVVTDFTTREITITLSREQSAGVYRTNLIPLYLSTPPTIVSGGITVSSVSHTAWTDPAGFNPEMPDAYDRAFSARQEIVIVAIDDRQDGGGYIVSMTSNGQVIEDSYQVEADYQPEVLTQDGALTADAVRPPGTDVLVKAAVPCITTVGVVARQPVEYNGPDADSLGASLATAINQLPISTEELDAFTVSNLLASIEPSLIFVSVSMNGTIWGQNDTDISVTQIAGVLTIPTNTAAKVSPNDTYFTTTSALVTVTLV